MNLIQEIKSYWEKNPIIIILLSAIFVRLLAVVFAKGFGMHDDHFAIIEIAQDWVSNSMNWFTDSHIKHINLFYVGFHYCLFYISDNILGITDPQIKMFWVRFLHAAYSLLIILFGYRLTEKISNKENAKMVGILLALLWPLPFFSVRNLVEVVCIPPILAGFYYLVKDDEETKKFIIISGMLFALAFTIRFQSAFFIAGIGLVLLSQKKWMNFIYFSLGFLLTTIVTMGIVDFLIYGSPYKTLLYYVFYNIEHQYDYSTQPWYNYILLILGLLIPPISLYLSFGFFRTIKKYALLFWPTFVFVLFHSYFSNKQERFIIPAIPMIILLGIIGWNKYISESQFWKNKMVWIKSGWVFFWSVNSILLILFTFTYGKKNRVESFSYLSNKENVKSIIWDTGNNGTIFPPKFYLNKRIPIYTNYDYESAEKLIAKIKNNESNIPGYIVFLGDDDLKDRVLKLEDILNKKLIFENKIDPSLVDAILYKLNPRHNLNQTSYIYRAE